MLEFCHWYNKNHEVHDDGSSVLEVWCCRTVLLLFFDKKNACNLKLFRFSFLYFSKFIDTSPISVSMIRGQHTYGLYTEDRV